MTFKLPALPLSTRKANALVGIGEVYSATSTQSTLIADSLHRELNITKATNSDITGGEDGGEVVQILI